jgi:alkylhydroperoxidase family enzyme
MSTTHDAPSPGGEMFLEVPEDRDPITHVWGHMVPGIGPAAAAFSAAVYEHGTLALEEFEAARLRVAQINGCRFCLDWRSERDGRTVDNCFMGEVEQWRTSEVLGVRAALAAEFAERFVLDHHGIDDDLWARLRAHYTDEELVELAMCIGSWMTFGRLNRVFGLDVACTLPGHATPGRAPGSGR